MTNQPTTNRQPNDNEAEMRLKNPGSAAFRQMLKKGSIYGWLSPEGSEVQLCLSPDPIPGKSSVQAAHMFKVSADFVTALGPDSATALVTSPVFRALFSGAFMLQAEELPDEIWVYPEDTLEDLNFPPDVVSAHFQRVQSSED